MEQCRRIISLLMCFLLLLSSNGFALHEHFCSTENSSTYSLISSETCKHEKKTCCASNAVKSCANSNIEEHTEKEDCCNDELRFSKLEIEYLTSVSEIEIENAEVIVFTDNFIHLASLNIKSENLFLKGKNPPPLLKDNQCTTFLQCFRC